MHLKQDIFFSVFFRFSSMLTMYEKNIFLVVFVWFWWLVSRCKNKLLFVFDKICIANISQFQKQPPEVFCRKSCFQKFIVTAIFNLLLKRWFLLIIIKVTLISILILTAIDSTQETKMFSSQSNLQAFKRYISDITFFCQSAEFHSLFCHSPISWICLIYISLPNLYFHSIISTKKSLKVLQR